MPYITKQQRTKWDKLIILIEKIMPKENIDGELNYFITRILKKVYKDTYAEMNKAIGLLECVKQEYYRRIMSPYEDKKKSINGDVQ